MEEKAWFKNQTWKSTKLLFKCLVQSYSKVGDICTAAFLSSSSHLFKIHRISLIFSFTSEIHLKCQNCPAVILSSDAFGEIVLSLNHLKQTAACRMYTYMQTIRFTYFPFIYQYYAQQPGHMKEYKHSANLKPLSLIPPMFPKLHATLSRCI